MINLFFRIRYVAVIAVLASLAGAFLLFLLGGFNTYTAFAAAVGKAGNNGTHSAVVAIIESLDNFLLGFVLLYFAYSTYFLFVAKEVSDAERQKIDMPRWLQVDDLGHMKRVLLEVILVLLAVFFLKLVITEEEHALEWTVLVIPATIVAVAVSLKLVHFD